MYYDDTGAVGCFWSDIWNVTRTVDTPSALLSVEDTQSILVDNFAQNNGDSLPADEITVDRIDLGHAYSFVEDAPNEYRLIPVYDITGSTTFYDRENGYPISFLAINAPNGYISSADIDGAILHCRSYATEARHPAEAV